MEESDFQQAERELLKQFVGPSDMDGQPTAAPHELPASPTLLSAMPSWAALDSGTTLDEEDSKTSSFQSFTYDEKGLREAAAAEVAQQQALQQKEDARRGGVKRKLLSAEEKAKQSRDRNREHARNTRLRKKAYVGKLTQLVQDLTREKDAFLQQQRIKAQQKERQLSDWRRALNLFLEYRVAGEQDRSRWAEAMEESSLLLLPITPYRSFKKTDIVNDSRVVVGIDAIIADTRSFVMCVESLGGRSQRWKQAMARGQRAASRYHIAPEDVVTSADELMAKFSWETDNAVVCGAQCECALNGMLRCKFSLETNRLVMCELMFDVMGLMHQLQKAAGPSAELPIVPNTLDLASAPSSLARVITQAAPSLPIVSVNDAWIALFGYSPTETEGCSLSIIQGFATDVESVQRLTHESLSGLPSSMVVANHRKNGEKFCCLMRLFPLSSDTNEITHFLGVMESLETPVQNLSLFY